MRILRHGPLGFWILPAAWALTAGTLDSQRRAKMACGLRASNWDPAAMAAEAAVAAPPTGGVAGKKRASVCGEQVMAKPVARAVVGRMKGGRVKQRLERAWGSDGAMVWAAGGTTGGDGDVLEAGGFGTVQREKAERRRRVGWDGQIEELWVVPLRCVTRRVGARRVHWSTIARSG